MNQRTLIAIISGQTLRAHHVPGQDAKPAPREPKAQLAALDTEARAVLSEGIG
jgi:hypothetical protein